MRLKSPRQIAELIRSGDEQQMKEIMETVRKAKPEVAKTLLWALRQKPGPSFKSKSIEMLYQDIRSMLEDRLLP